MKKRTYRSVVLKDLDREKLSKAVEGKRVVFGLDVGKEEILGAFRMSRDEVLMTVRWDHLRESREAVGLVRSLPAGSVEVAMEPSGSYGDPLRELFLKAGIGVYRVSPKRCHDAAEVYDGVPSQHDAKSAAIVSQLQWDGLSEPWPLRSQEDRRLSAAVDVMDVYQHQVERNVNRLEGLLGRVWPEVTQYLELDSVTLLDLLRMGGPREVALEPGRARWRMRKAGGRFLSREKIEAVLKSARETIGCEMIELEIWQLRELAEEILRCKKLVQESRKRVEKLSQREVSVAEMGKVVGKATAAVLVSDVGNPRNYKSSSSYVKSLGLNIKERSSGKHRGQLKVTKRGPGRPRMYLYLAVLRLVQKDKIVEAWYRKKVERDGGKKQKAITALMRKLSRALWHVARGKEFDARLLFDVSRLGLART